MNELKALESMGLTLPSPAYLLGALVFGLVGYFAYRQGRKASRPAMVGAGVLLMVYPYAVSDTWLLWLVGAAITGWVGAHWN